MVEQKQQVKMPGHSGTSDRADPVEYFGQILILWEGYVSRINGLNLLSTGIPEDGWQTPCVACRTDV